MNCQAIVLFPTALVQTACGLWGAALLSAIKKYDILLYRRDSGQYVLHRVLKVRRDDYVICGDNRWKCEYGITDRHVIGVLTAIIRDGKEIPMCDGRFRLYAHLWCDLFPLRAGILRCLSVMKRGRRRT